MSLSIALVLSIIGISLILIDFLKVGSLLTVLIYLIAIVLVPMV